MRTLVTLDPVSLVNPDYEKVTANAGTWINVNANPDAKKRAQESGLGNLAAGLGSSWDSDPKGYATQHYNANINHSEARQVLLLKP